MYIFDDIVFHICSIFDYVANLIGLLYLGKEKRKWNNIVRSARDKKTN